MLLEEFNKKYNLSDAHIHVRILEGAIPRSVLTSQQYGYLKVNENYFIRRIEFRSRVKNYIQDMYFLLTEVASDIKLGKVFGVSNTYFSQSIWNRYDGTILNYKINGSDWKVFRKMRKLHRKIERLGVKFNIEEILDAEIDGAYTWQEYKINAIKLKETMDIQRPISLRELVEIVRTREILA